MAAKYTSNVHKMGPICARNMILVSKHMFEHIALRTLSDTSIVATKLNFSVVCFCQTEDTEIKIGCFHNTSKGCSGFILGAGSLCTLLTCACIVNFVFKSVEMQRTGESGIAVLMIQDFPFLTQFIQVEACSLPSISKCSTSLNRFLLSIVWSSFCRPCCPSFRVGFFLVSFWHRRQRLQSVLVSVLLFREGSRVAGSIDGF